MAATDPLYPRLKGRWRLRRRLYDNLAGRWMHADGKAEWRPAEEAGGTPGALDFMETLRLDGVADAFRGYRYHFPGGARLVIEHADGSPFVAVDLSDGQAKAEHLCGQDLYRGRLRFDTAGRFWIAWEVRGPRKDYRMVTVYRRAGTE